MKVLRQALFFKSKQLACYFFAGLLLVLATASQVKARSLEIVKVHIEAYVLPEGDLQVTESRTVDFSGQFTGMYQQIDFFGIDRYTDILVREKNKPYTLVSEFPTTKPGTYSVYAENDDYFTVDWSFDALDERRTFTLEYTAQAAVVAHNDVAELYYKFVGERWRYPAKEVFIRLVLPGQVAEDELRAWGHGPLQGEVMIKGPSEITWQTTDLPPSTFLEGRVVFPLELVPGAAKRSGTEALPLILKEEERWAKEANVLRVIQRLEPWAIIFVLALFSLGLFLRWRQALNRKNAWRGTYYRELPADYPPEVAGYLWHKKNIKPESLSAQILNLARLKQIKIEESPDKKTFQLTKLLAAAPPSSAGSLVLDFIFETVGRYFNPQKEEETPGEEETAPSSVTFEQVQNFAKQEAGQFYTFYNTWTWQVRQAGEEQKFFVKHSFFNVGCLALLLVFILSFTVMFLWGLYLLGLVMMVLPLIFLWVSPRLFYSEYGADQLMKWRAFRKFLLHFSAMDRSALPALAIWEHYMVYAVVLGVAKQVAEQLALVFPRPEADPTFSQTSLFTPGKSPGLIDVRRMALAAHALERTISGARRTAYSSRHTGRSFLSATRSRGAQRRGSFSSGRGSGGGFSSGGGRGSGGGGGGFR